MKFALYEAVDNRDGRTMLWLHDAENHRVATFCPKWAPSRIRQRTITARDGIVWEHETIMVVHAALSTAKHLDSWELPL